MLKQLKASWPRQREEVPHAYPELGASARHGAGRVLSRKQARKTFAALDIKDRLAQRGVLARSPDLREEVPQAYRDAETLTIVMR